MQRPNSGTGNLHRRRFALSAALAVAVGAAAPRWAAAASAVWNGNIDATWANDSNWTSGAPGATTGTTNTDTATFNTNPANGTTTPLVVDSGRNIGSIIFDTGAGNFNVGSTSGNALLLSAAGAVQIASTFSGTNQTETLNSPITFEGAYSLTNSSAAASNDTLTLNGTLASSSAFQVTINPSSAPGKVILAGGTAALPSSMGSLYLQGGTANVTGYLNTSGKTIIQDGGTLNWSGTGTFNAGNYVGVGDGNAATLNVTAGSLTVEPGNNESFFVGNGSTSSVNVSGGILTLNVATAGNTVGLYLGDGYNNNGGGTGTLTLSSSGQFTTGTTTGNFLLGSETTTAGTGTINLNGGTLSTERSISEGVGTGATAIVNFNGGTLQATAADTAIISGITAANVRNGGAIFDTQAFNVGVPQPLVHSTIGGDNATDGGLTKIGSGTLSITGANSYTGPTTVKAGTLSLGTTGSITSTALNVAGGVFDASASTASTPVPSFTSVAGAGTVVTPSGGITLAGSGTLAPGGTVSTPGDQPGTLTITGGLTVGASAALVFNLGTASDKVNVSSTLTLNDPQIAQLSVVEGSGFGSNTYVLLAGGALVNATAFSPSSAALPGGFTGTLQEQGNNLVLTVVPEPASLGMIVPCGLLLLLRRRKLTRADALNAT